jgi:putative membrane protein
MNKVAITHNFRYKKAGISILVVMHIVGVAGFLSPLAEWFVFLTPMNLVVTAGALWIDSKPGNTTGWPIALTVMLVGYLVEVAGVKTGLIFGEYAYLDVLGWKVLEVPPIIGLNWLVVIWASHSVARTLQIPPALRWLATAGLAVLLDLVIEPVAIHFGFWTWHGAVPPLQNYIAWFVTAAALALVFEKYPLVQKPRLGLVAYICQMLFFGVLLRAITP